MKCKWGSLAILWLFLRIYRVFDYYMLYFLFKVFEFWSCIWCICLQMHVKYLINFRAECHRWHLWVQNTFNIYRSPKWAKNKREKFGVIKFALPSAQKNAIRFSYKIMLVFGYFLNVCATIDWFLYSRTKIKFISIETILIASKEKNESRNFWDA